MTHLPVSPFKKETIIQQMFPRPFKYVTRPTGYLEPRGVGGMNEIVVVVALLTFLSVIIGGVILALYLYLSDGPVFFSFFL